MSSTQELSAKERILDSDAILADMRRAVREALLQHKRDGMPVVVWQDGKVVWIPPEEIPDDEE
jgi:hypothetical protein